MVVAFQAYGRPLVAVSEFKYLGRVLTDSDDNWTTVVGNLRKAWKQWERMSCVLGQEISYPRSSGKIYKAVVHAKILFGAESLVISPCIGRTLGDFHQMVARWMEKIQLKRDMTGR